jgi:tetratricopeptide (TPR) repeat protein
VKLRFSKGNAKPFVWKVQRVGLLNSAIEAELKADYRRAISYYKRLVQHGSSLDRVGIHQAIARCYEKLGSLNKAARWHEKAGQGYMKLPGRLMGASERAYYGMVEFHCAIQDYAPSLAMRKAAKGYLDALSVCLRTGKEGYSHEMLFAAHLCVKIRDFTRAGQFFADAAEEFKKEKVLKLAKDAKELATKYYERSGNSRTASKLRTARI